MIKVKTQAELERALAHTNNGSAELIVCVGDAHYTLRGNSTATLWENSTATLWGNSTATLRGNSTATLRENSTATLWGNAAVRAFDWTTVKSKSPSAVLLSHSDEVNVVGDLRQLTMQTPQSVTDWLEFYGIEIEDGTAVLYKAVGTDYESRNGITYRPGEETVAPDWDFGARECGGGLHFSPHPQLALDFRPAAKHFLACPVRVADIAFHPNSSYPNKVKARATCGPAVEVDGNGEAI